MSQAALQRTLYDVKGFHSPKLEYEQYDTPAEIAAALVWQANMQGDISDKSILDAGSGTGILGIAALLLGAKHVHFVEIDADAISIMRENLSHFKFTEYTIHHMPIQDFIEQVDTVLENPPFGTKKKHADKAFLETAFRAGKVLYSIHKESTESFLRAIATDSGWKLTHRITRDFPLKKQFDFHTKAREKAKVLLCRFAK